jgi:DNA (cytosine-5)-methyltransferase 1
MSLSTISLFTGAAGLDLGLEKSGFSIAECVEIDSERCEIIRWNRQDWNVVQADVRQVSGRSLLRRAGLKKGDRFILSGASPCAAFSKAAFWVPGRFDRYHRDRRRTLVYEFARLVGECQPQGFLFENVASLAYAPNRTYLDTFVRMARKAGYSVAWQILNAAEYGVPQKRERLFIVGLKNGTPFVFPEATHYLDSRPHQKGRRKAVSVKETIGGLDDQKVNPAERPGGKYGHLLDEVPPGGNYLFFTKERLYPRPLFKWRSRYWSFLAKLSPDEPSWTIPAHPAYYGGPFHWRSRRLRIPEVKRLQTFPKGWKLPESHEAAWSALGDATPPLLSEMIGRAMKTQIET